MADPENNSNRGELLTQGRATDHLANERTFLAWIRTSIAAMGLGFVVAKFSVWLRQLSASIAPQAPIRPAGPSLPLGVAIMAFGSVMAIIGLVHYRAVNRAIARGRVNANDGLVIVVGVVVALLGAFMIAYMLSTVPLT
jgi:putative membrane protein